jgi:hypothetical protein
VRIDHVIYATADLDAAAARVKADLGLTAVAGGRHDGLGTHNRIIPLGDGSFLELLAVADPDEANSSPLGAALQAVIARGDPGRFAPEAGGATDAISWIEVAGDRSRLEQWLGGAEPTVRVVDGEPAVRAVGIGARELRT